jgi:hypothetical protein
VIPMRQAGSPGSAVAVFDGYVPLTATWPGVGGLLDAPRCVRLQDANGYLELKFHPHTGILVEVVLAAAPGIRNEQGNLAPRISGPAGLMPFLDPADALPGLGHQLVIKAYPDYLCVCFGSDPGQWAGPGPVLFGLADDQRLTAIAAPWTGAERESVLAGQ